MEQKKNIRWIREVAMSMLHKVERFLGRTEMPPTKFGRLAVNDPRLVSDLRNGRELRPGTVARVDRFLREFSA